MLESIQPTLAKIIQVVDIPAALQWGALGVLALVLVAVLGGFGWYVRSVEARAAKREEGAQKRQDKTLDVLIELTKALGELTHEVSEHRQESASDIATIANGQQAIMAVCEKFSRRGIGE